MTHNNRFHTSSHRPTAAKEEIKEEVENPITVFKKIYNEQQEQIANLTLMIREQLPNAVRMTINTLVINRVHCRDRIRSMLNAGVEKSSDFLWNIQMRYNYRELTTPKELDR